MQKLFLLALLAVPLTVQAQDTGTLQQGYWACVRTMRACDSMNPGVRSQCSTTGVPTSCLTQVQQWNAAHPFPGDGPLLTPQAQTACDRQAIANAANDPAASTTAGLNCTW